MYSGVFLGYCRCVSKVFQRHTEAVYTKVFAPTAEEVSQFGLQWRQVVRHMNRVYPCSAALAPWLVSRLAAWPLVQKLVQFSLTIAPGSAGIERGFSTLNAALVGGKRNRVQTSTIIKQFMLNAWLRGVGRTKEAAGALVRSALNGWLADARRLGEREQRAKNTPQDWQNRDAHFAEYVEKYGNPLRCTLDPDQDSDEEEQLQVERACSSVTILGSDAIECIITTAKQLFADFRAGKQKTKSRVKHCDIAHDVKLQGFVDCSDGTTVNAAVVSAVLEAAGIETPETTKKAAKKKTPSGDDTRTQPAKRRRGS